MSNLLHIHSICPAPKHFEVGNATKYLKMKCQRQSLLFLATYSYHQITQGRIKVIFPFTDSFYCIDSSHTPIEMETVQKIEENINSLIKSNHEIELVLASKNDLISYFKKMKYNDKVIHLQNPSTPENVECIRFLDFIDLTYGIHYETNIEKLGSFHLTPYGHGFFLQFPRFLSDGTVDCKIPKEIINVSSFSKWACENHFDSIVDINQYIKSGKDINEIDKKVQEFDDIKLKNIINALVNDFPNHRMIAVSGCSSAGKSTFANLLKNQIQSCFNNEYECQIIPMDTYFMNRDERPLDENGNIDYESMRIIHIDLLASRINDLLDGKSIPDRQYDYVDGVGGDIPGSKKTLKNKGFVIIEGLHALNSEFLKKVTSTNILKIYISPIAPLSIDYEHSIDPHDILLLRRILRDFNQRGTSPRDNIEIWPSVETGAAKYLLPLINSADIFFTNQIVYEMNAVQSAVIPLMKRYKDPVEKNPQIANEVSDELRRLITLLSLFEPLSIDKIPDRLPTKKLLLNTLETLNKTD